MNLQKRKWKKKPAKFKTEVPIILECLYENYRMEGEKIMSGKNIHSTMIYPFLRMLSDHYKDMTMEEIHKRLWKIYNENLSLENFVNRSEAELQKLQKEKVE